MPCVGLLTPRQPFDYLMLLCGVKRPAHGANLEETIRDLRKDKAALLQILKNMTEKTQNGPKNDNQ